MDVKCEDTIQTFSCSRNLKQSALSGEVFTIGR